MRCPVTIMLILAASACSGDDPSCGELEEDRENGRCVCPEGTTPTEDGWSCVLPDGGSIRNPSAPDAALHDGGVSEGDACVGCRCIGTESRPCQVASGIGVCAMGRQQCEEGQWLECVGEFTPQPESCNGLDDDCNGTPDDGSAARACPVADHVLSAGCSGGQCFTERCADGFLDCDRDFTTGCEEALGTRSTCLACGDSCGWACGPVGCNDATVVEAGQGFTVAIRADRTLAAWGANGAGQLGDETRAERVSPVSLTIADVARLAVGGEHACASIGGDVRCWGDGSFGQLGSGSAEDSLVPLRAFGDTRSISAGQGHTCAVDRSNSAWCWGAITYGGQSLQRMPTTVGVGGVVQVTSGADHACARTTSGSVRCWGTNSQGVLGSGYAYAGSGPTTVTGLDDATHVSAGGYHNCAVRSEGTVVCWGLGAGVQSESLVSIEGLDQVETLDCGGYNACAIRSDRTLWCWGSNSNGEVGDGTTERRVRPLQVLEGVVDVSVGQFHVCAVLADGGVRCWGNNDAGELGTGTRDPSLVPAGVRPPS